MGVPNNMAVKTTKATAAAKKPPAKAAEQPAPKSAAPATITSKQLSATLAERHEMGKKESETVVNDVFEMLVTHLKSGDRLRISGLGILEVKDRPARMGRNPATGEAIQIKASKKIAFRAAKELKDAI